MLWQVGGTSDSNENSSSSLSVLSWFSIRLLLFLNNKPWYILVWVSCNHIITLLLFVASCYFHALPFVFSFFISIAKPWKWAPTYTDVRSLSTFRLKFHLLSKLHQIFKKRHFKGARNNILSNSFAIDSLKHCVAIITFEIWLDLVIYAANKTEFIKKVKTFEI
jgi:hypothetical protein